MPIRCADDNDSDDDGNTFSDGNWAWQISNFTDENGPVDIRVLGDTETASDLIYDFWRRIIDTTGERSTRTMHA